MNLVNFLKSVDTNISNMQNEQLRAVIHEFARTLSENKRTDFLEMMQSVCSNSQDKKQYKNLNDEVQDTMIIIEKINEGERCLDSKYDYEYHEYRNYRNYWEDDDEYEIVFYDPENLLPDIEKAIELVHKCVDTENYKDGLKLAQALYSLEISVDGDYNDYDCDNPDINFLFEKELLNGNLKSFILELIFLTYMENKLSDRAEKIYSVMYHYEDIKLEDIMQVGNSDLPDFKEFLSLWLKYLGKQSGKRANELLLEVINMINDKEILLESARIYYDKHPELYKKILEEGINKEENNEMLKIGLEALKNIYVSYIIRADIALLTADYALKLNDIKTAEKCYLEAFKSDTSFINYLRVRFVSKDYSKYSLQVKQTYEKMHNQVQAPCRYQEYKPEENSLSDNDYCAILFFEKEFEKTLEIGLNKKEPLGWSNTFMKEGIALFLMLMYKGDIPIALDKMLEKAILESKFKSEEFVFGTNIEEKDDKKQFLELFNNWKKDIKIGKEDYNKWMLKIEQLIELRVNGIMERSRTKYYGECAAFIVSCGEVSKSNGIKYAKERIISKYRTQYSRRHSFTGELKKY